MTPLPSLSWADGAEIWNSMLDKDLYYSRLRNEKILERHPSLRDSYRTILFDWLSEVSHECKFYRETYHMALDFIDRYLATQSDVGKLELQLIGTTCLFLAAKFEEIRPPTVGEFADLTDGACKPEDIINFEVVILRAINWEITPTTPNNWLNVFTQILIKDESDQNNVDTENFFILPASNGIFSSIRSRIAAVIDLALLHLDSLKYSSSTLAASALYHFTDAPTVLQSTGYSHHELVDCIKWLEPFVEAIREIREPVFNKEDNQIHTHIATAKLLEKVTSKQKAETKLRVKRKEEELIDPILLSPNRPTTLLTPPRSAKKRKLNSVSYTK